MYTLKIERKKKESRGHILDSTSHLKYGQWDSGIFLLQLNHQGKKYSSSHLQ